MKSFLMLIWFLLGFCLNIFAQGSITGTLVDKAANTPLNLATVAVYQSADTSLVGYRLSDNKGQFLLNNLPLNISLRMIISHAGYETYRREFLLTPTENALQLDSVLLETSAHDLDDVVVVAERPPILVRNDTVEFNANAFKTLPNAVVEDLLKKLPGVAVDREGNITVSGKPVNRILVDGKSFFGSDPKMASRNLPAQTIDKIQVMDDMDELNARGDDDRTQVGKVINLSFKPGYKKGMFGKAYAGAGTQGVYEAGAIANLFRDTLQMSLMGYTNNLNRPGFTISDLMQTGGISRSSALGGSRSTSMSMGSSGSSITINGINFGGQSNEGGVSASTGAGLNLNHSPDTKKSFYAQYFYGYVDTEVKGGNENTTSYGDTLLYRNAIIGKNIYSNSHVAGAGFRIKPDSLSTWLGQINYTNGRQDNFIRTYQNAYSNFVDKINLGNTHNDKFNRAQTANASWEYTRLSRNKKGRRFSLNQQTQYNDKRNDFNTLAEQTFYYPNVYDHLLHQLRMERIPVFFASLSGNYSEPLTENLTLRSGLNYAFEKMKNDISTFDLGHGNKLPMPSLTNGFDRRTHNASAFTSLEWKIKEWRIRPGLRLQKQDFNTDFSNLPAPVIQKQTNLLPQLSITRKELSMNYVRNVVLPDYQYFIAVNDNTNPFVIKAGNASLLPTVTDGISLNFNKYDTKRSLNIWSWANASFRNNDIIQNVTLNSDGVQVINPVNADGTKNFSANFGISKDYKTNSAFTWSWNVGGYTQFINNGFLYNNIPSRQRTLQHNNWGGINLNWNDKFEWNTNFGIGTRSTSNTNKYFNTFSSTSKSLGIELINRQLKNLIFESNLNYSFNNAIRDPAFRKYWLWNAAVNYTFLKDQRGVLKLSAFDILNQLRSSGFTTTQNQVIFSYSNVLPQHFMLNFTYNIFAAGAKKKVGGQWNLW